VELKELGGWTALMLATAGGRLDIVQLLLQHGADVNAVNCRGRNALMVTDNIAAVQLLLDSGADISATDSEGHNALFKAAYEENVSMMEFLVQRGLTITVVSKTGRTLLNVAVLGGQKTAAEWLIQRGVPIAAAGENGETALHAACGRYSCDDAAMVEMLLTNGADMYHCIEGGRPPPLYAAVYHGNLECAKVLIAAGVDVKHAESDGVTALHLAVTTDHSASVQLLLEYGATAVMNEIVPVRCTCGALCCATATALMLCTTADTVKLLQAAGADVNVTNDVGDTCLHVAAKHHWKAPRLCLLIKAGADLHAVNNDGKTAAQIAHDRGYTLTAQLLNRAAQ
jgi:uncharacterized protein